MSLEDFQLGPFIRTLSERQRPLRVMPQGPTQQRKPSQEVGVAHPYKDWTLGNRVEGDKGEGSLLC